MAATLETDTPRLYVGTYAKYNSGSIQGAWLDLTSDIDDFYERCAELHKDETDPEFMFQDFEYFPKSLYCESGIEKELIEFLEYLESDDYSYEMLTALIDNGLELSEAENCYTIPNESSCSFEETIGYYFIDEMCCLEIPEEIKSYFDYQKYGETIASEGTFIQCDDYILACL